jgi:hypothetical protein
MTLSINRKTILSLIAAGTMAGAIATSTSSAQAGGGWGHGHGYGRGGAVAAGLVGGLALGAIATHAYRPHRSYYGPVVVGPECYSVRRKVWTDYGWRRVRQTVCD